MKVMLQYTLEMLGSMLAAVPLIGGVRWLCAIRREKRGQTVSVLHEVLTWLFGLCLAGVLSQTVLNELAAIVQGMEPGGNRVNLRLFLVFRQTWDEVFKNGNPSYFFLNFVGNILVFVPMGLFPPLLWRSCRKFWKMLLLGCGMSVLIELTQLLLPRGTDVDDVWLNTLGAAAGYLLFRLVLKIAPRFAERCCDRGETT